MSSPSALTGNPNTHDPSTFATGMSATCLCGSIRVTINDSDLFTKPRGHICHCSNCRAASGSYASSNLAISASQVAVSDPSHKLKKYKDRATGSGKVVERCFCSECGNPIMSIAEIFPDMVILKMGIFPRIPKPECESFALHRHEWQGKHEGLVQYEIVRGGKKLGE
ncbi:hypothetical protein CC86DRAFT_330075 [Ophiobolus disseminans]|uniref:CENP-V/GFA domain-containing protein n=1 Tax=Ophiobolus disseminans TaxID=1469910 RepID=A0A6A6ZPG4_9PLEO|nr:hypothetical protein CC86DRAFT_330075 [Ophiobolus disseminans]